MKRVTQLIAELRLVTHELDHSRCHGHAIVVMAHLSVITSLSWDARSMEDQLGDELGAMGATFCGNWDVAEALRAWLGRWRGRRHGLLEPVEECVDR
jgi:hypothetical protein